MRKIDYLELCQFVIARQAFVIRWCDRYWRMNRLYWTQSRLIREQIDALWGEKWNLNSDEEAQLWLLDAELKRIQYKWKRCSLMHSVLVRYGQYFSNLPFRVLMNQPIPDCYWYVPDHLTDSTNE